LRLWKPFWAIGKLRGWFRDKALFTSRANRASGEFSAAVFGGLRFHLSPGKSDLENRAKWAVFPSKRAKKGAKRPVFSSTRVDSIGLNKLKICGKLKISTNRQVCKSFEYMYMRLYVCAKSEQKVNAPPRGVPLFWGFLTPGRGPGWSRMF